jgi:phosphoglycolate phosphatase
MPKLLVDDKIIDCTLVIFDKDGTLIEQKPVLLALAKARFKSLAHLVSRKVAEEWAKAVGINLRTEEIDNDGPLAVAPTREEVLVAAFVIYQCGCAGWDDAKKLAEKAYEEADKLMKPPYGAVLLIDVRKTLEALKGKGFKIALATTDSHKRAEESLNELGLTAFFDAVLGDDDVEHGKPAPDMILKACKLTRCLPKNAVMVGDSRSDMLMGKNAKVRACIGVLTGSTPKEKLEKIADIVAPSVADLRVG